MNDSTSCDPYPAQPEGHFITEMGISLRFVEGSVRGRALLRPAMWVAGTRRLRLAILATMVDVVAGHVPDGPRTPTIDLRVQRTGALPEEGEIELVARADRVGRNFIVAETIATDANGRMFARATTTFLNQVMDATPFGEEAQHKGSIESFERLVGARVVDDTTLEVVPTPQLGNGRFGTVQGGVQAFLAELAAERVMAPGAEAVDLDVRYLSRVKVGPLRGRAFPVGHTGGLESVRVVLYDAGNADRTVSTVLLLMQPPRAALR